MVTRILRASEKLEPFSSPVTMVVSLISLVLAIFILDYFTPPGFSHGVLYIYLILLSTFSLDLRVVVVSALISCTFTAIVGMTIYGNAELSSDIKAVVLWNRVESIVLIVFIAIACGLLISLFERIKRSKRLLDIASETMGFGGWVFNLKTQRFTWSRTVANLHGIDPRYSPSREERLSLIAPEYRESIRKVFNECIDNGTPYSEEIEILHAVDSTRLWVRTVGKPVYDSGGNIVGVEGSFSDISERKNMLNESERLRLRIEHILNYAGSAIIGLDSAGAITFSNTMAQLSLDYNDVELIGKNLFELVKPMSSTKEMLSLDAFGVQISSLENKKVSVNNELFCTRSGHYIPVNYTSVGVSHEQFGGAVVVFEDMTDKYGIESKLRKAQRLKTVGHLTGGVAHDFNNILTLILGNAELLNEDLVGHESLREMVVEIIKSAEDGAKLTRQLLSFSGQQSLAPESIKIDVVVDNMLPLLKRSNGSSIHYNIIHESNVKNVLVDVRQLEIAIVELCLNASRAMHEGGTITITTRNVVVDESESERVELRSGCYVQLVVEDHGIGISEKNLENVFEPFYSSKAFGNGEAGGVGLSMVYGFVNQSSGRVSIYSEKGVGTAVKIYLPCVSGDVLENSRLEPIIPDEINGRLTILVVDDNESVLGFTERRLNKLGYKVITASNGNEALEIIESGRKVDMLLTDVIMDDGMNGKELVDAVRRKNPSLRYGFSSGFTAHVFEGDEKISGNKLLSKPFSKEELSAFVKAILSGSK